MNGETGPELRELMDRNELQSLREEMTVNEREREARIKE